MPTPIKPWFAQPTPLKPASQISIIGAGLAGCACAYTLAKAGFRVTVYDQNPEPAQGASGNPVALLRPYPSANENLADQFFSGGFAEIKAFLAKHPNVWHNPCGVLYFADRPKRQTMLERWFANRHFESDFLQPVDAERASEIAGVELTDGGVFFPSAGLVKPAELCRAWLDAFPEQITFAGNTEIQSPADLKADAVVIACAHKALQFRETQHFPLRASAGQLTLAPQTILSGQLKTVLCYDGYCTPAVDGLHILGATHRAQNSTADLAILKQDHQTNLANLASCSQQLAEDLGALSLQGRVGMRCHTPDHLPMVGPIADPMQFKHDYAKIAHGGTLTRTRYPQARYLDKLYICTGFGSKGVASSLLAARVLAAQLTGDKLPVSPQLHHALHPSRFYLRALKKNTQP